MKRLLTIATAVLCLLSACQTSPAPPPQVERPDSAAIYHQMAWREMFAGSLSEAEGHAYRAFMLSRDSALECGSLSLLCYIYYREGKQQELQLLMQTVSPDTYVGVMDVQMRAEQARTGRERWGFALIVAALLLLTGAAGYWYVRRVKSLARLYQQRVARVRRDMREALEQLAEASVEEVSGVQAHDSVESQATCPPSSPAPPSARPRRASTCSTPSSATRTSARWAGARSRPSCASSPWWMPPWPPHSPSPPRR